MLPSPHVRPSQVFHESASSVWFPPKLPCEEWELLFVVFLQHHGQQTLTSCQFSYSIWTCLQFHPWFPQKFCLLFFISFEASFLLLVIHLGFLFFHLEFLHHEYIWGSQDFFLNFFFFFCIYLSIVLAFNLVWFEIVLIPFKDLTSAATWWHLVQVDCG